MRRHRRRPDPCRRLRRDLQSYLDEECPGDTSWAVARHLSGCQPCYADAEAFRRVRAAVARRRVPPDPRVVARLTGVVGAIAGHGG